MGIYKFLSLSDHTAVILLSIAIILVAGFLLTRITKRLKLPNVTGYVVAGVIIGPFALQIIPADMVANMGFMSDIALAFIAFSIGRFFKKEVFKETGLGIIIITLMESLVAGVLVTLSLRLFFSSKLDWNFCLLLGAIATATAPLSTMVTIRQYHAKGNFVNSLLQVVAFDDAVCLIVFSIATAVINAQSSAGIVAADILLPIAYNIGALGLGFLGGLLLSKLVTPTRSEDNRLILTITILLAIAGICALVQVSPLLACMVVGTVYINKTQDKELFRQISKFSAPVLAMFFVISGMNLDLRTFATLGIIGVAYFLIRIVGKYVGAYTGSVMVKASKEVRNYLGLALVPQAGVAIGLAFLGKRILPPEEGAMLLTIILSSSVLYELFGPACAKIALIYSGSISKERLKK